MTRPKKYAKRSKRKDIERLVDQGFNPQTIADKLEVSLSYVIRVRSDMREEFRDELAKFKRLVGEE
jgi:hypothetical protein